MRVQWGHGFFSEHFFLTDHGLFRGHERGVPKISWNCPNGAFPRGIFVARRQWNAYWHLKGLPPVLSRKPALVEEARDPAPSLRSQNRAGISGARNFQWMNPCSSGGEISRNVWRRDQPTLWRSRRCCGAAAARFHAFMEFNWHPQS
jgi:hypothetical protein